MSNRQLPQATDIEMALLGSMMIYPTAIETAVEQGLDSSDFFHQSNRIVYKSILDLYNERKPADASSLITRLTDEKNLQSIGGTEYILKLADAAGSGANAKFYANTIQDRA